MGRRNPPNRRSPCRGVQGHLGLSEGDSKSPSLQSPSLVTKKREKTSANIPSKHQFNIPKKRHTHKEKTPPRHTAGLRIVREVARRLVEDHLDVLSKDRAAEQVLRGFARGGLALFNGWWWWWCQPCRFLDVSLEASPQTALTSFTTRVGRFVSFCIGTSTDSSACKLEKKNPPKNTKALRIGNKGWWTMGRSVAKRNQINLDLAKMVINCNNKGGLECICSFFWLKCFITPKNPWAIALQGD